MNESPPYPVHLLITRPEKQSRLTNFPFLGLAIRSILALPHLVILYFLQLAANLVFFIATFAILFTGRYPDGMRGFFVGYLRWTTNVGGYFCHLYDTYPPFSMDEQPSYPLRLEVEPQEVSRWLNFPIVGIFIKSILLIPHYVILFFLYIALLIVVLVGELGILFTGTFPEGMHRFVSGVFRWTMRVNGYQYSLTDAYPPFTMN